MPGGQAPLATLTVAAAPDSPPPHTPAIEDEYSGPKLEDGRVTVAFMKELMQWYKGQKKLHRKCAYQVGARARGPRSVRALARPGPTTAGRREQGGPTGWRLLSPRCAGHPADEVFISSISIGYFFNSFRLSAPYVRACHLPFL